ncbi:MAG: hypothetical protein OEM77_03090 [Nitrosopumilus sp.]|nr:hypothetical protein [Nitrosopumilus sp.]MDH3735821.1 hypothetical protein [Nitrosopumilus sp.]MDH3822448.1 hypothetical protein [Nitrosopumilus sp.]MDH3833139.1 hypothetical protein [Nitrosopumilus sp.]
MISNELLHEIHIGNLESYKMYTRPTAHRLYGSTNFQTISLSKHKKNVQQILEILALNGSLTTWEMAKIKLAGDLSRTKTKEKEYRRLLIGRIDRGKPSTGILQIGLIIKDGKSYKRFPGDKYRLTLHGMLYCLDVLNLTKNQIDTMASKYANILPKVFGKWEYLKSVIGEDVYKLRILSKGLLLNNLEVALRINPSMYELMSYLIIKYKKNFEYIEEEDLANQISLWFYTNLLYNKTTTKKKTTNTKKLQKIFAGDKEIQKWYLEFFNESKLYYQKSLDNILMMDLLN